MLGRDPTATVRLESLRISRYHARIVLNDEEAILEDLGSKTGTFLHGERIAEPARLGQGDSNSRRSVLADLSRQPSGRDD